MKRIVEKISHMASHPLARGSAIVLAGTTLANIGAYAYHLVVGRLLGPQQYGELASLFSFSYLLNVPSLVLQTVLTKYIAGFRAKQEVGKAKSLSLFVMKRIVIVSLIGTVIIWPLTGIIAGFLHIDHQISVLYMYLTSALWFVTVIQAGLLQGFQMFVPAMILTNVIALLRLGGGAVGAMMGVVETVAAGLITGVLGLLAYFVPLRFLYRAKEEAHNISAKELVSYSLPSFVSMLGMTSLYSTDILLAKHFLPPVEAGYYAALSVMGKIIFFAGSSVSYVLFPVVAERAKEQSDSRKLVYSALAAIGFISLGITAGYALLPKLALVLLFGPSYFPAAPYLGWFGVFLSLYSLSYLLTMTLLGRGNVIVWLFVAAATLIQIAAITLYHADISAILWVNCLTLAGLFIGLLLYYRHAVKNH